MTIRQLTEIIRAERGQCVRCGQKGMVVPNLLCAHCQSKLRRQAAMAWKDCGLGNHDLSNQTGKADKRLMRGAG
jgi:ribosomal protein L37E